MSKKIGFLKKNGIYYTNSALANTMINELNINYTKNFTIAEMAVGEGHILKYIIINYLKNNKDKKINQIINFFEKNIFAFDNRSDAIETCKAELTNIVEKYLKVNININWNIQNINILDEKELNKYYGRFDYIISNPPYIARRNLNQETVLKLKKQSCFCSKYNYNFYYYFMEMGFRLWNKKRKMVYITPNSYIKSNSAEKMNRFFFKGKYFEKIIDFRDKLMFENAKTFTAITVFSPYNCNIKIVDDNNTIISNKKYAEINSVDLNPFYEITTNNKLTLDDISKIRTGIATLNDKVFIIKDLDIIKKEKYYFTVKKNGQLFKIERKILKKGIRASNPAQINYVIFPYFSYNGQYQKMVNLKSLYPYAYKYLSSLLSMQYQKKYGIFWGRSQGIYDYNKEKIVISRNSKLHNNPFYVVKSGFIISGIFLIPNDNSNIFELNDYLNGEYVQNLLDTLSKTYVQKYKSLSSTLLKKLPINNDTP